MATRNAQDAESRGKMTSAVEGLEESIKLFRESVDAHRKSTDKMSDQVNQHETDIAVLMDRDQRA